jgi:hypothetical protein
MILFAATGSPVSLFPFFAWSAISWHPVPEKHSPTGRPICHISGPCSLSQVPQQPHICELALSAKGRWISLDQSRMVMPLVHRNPIRLRTVNSGYVCISDFTSILSTLALVDITSTYFSCKFSFSTYTFLWRDFLLCISGLSL